MRAAFMGIVVAMALGTTGAQAQLSGASGGITGTTGTIGRVSGATGRIGTAGQPVPAPGTRSDGGIAGASTRSGAGLHLQTIIPPSGPARTGLLGGESYERSGVAGRPRETDAQIVPGMGGVSRYERTLEQAGDAASGVGASPQAFAAGGAASAAGAATTGGGGDSTAPSAGRSLPPITPASPASGNANAQGSVRPDPGP